MKVQSLIRCATLLVTTCLAFNNPIIWQDLPDLDIFRVGDTYYYSAGTMHLSPGASILKSYDLINWQYIGHSVPELTFGPGYYLNTTATAYVGGVWASTMNHRKSNGVFYWYGCIDFAKTYIFTATDPAGKWTAHPPINSCYYDVGLLVDDDDTMYLAYGNTNINVVQLSSDGLRPIRDQRVWTESTMTLEGARFYHINNSYYIWLTRPADGQFVLKANSPWGPYTRHQILSRMKSPIPDSGTPHQGGLVNTPNGQWYYMSFLDAYPNGRMPTLAPITFDANGIPRITTDSSGGWGLSYGNPPNPSGKSVTPTGWRTDTFSGSSLHAEWQWNHNPDNSAWSLSNGLNLRTATVTDNLLRARNTLTHRIHGPKSRATFRLNLGQMRDGDVAGVAIMRDTSAYIGLQKQGTTLRLVQVTGITVANQNGGWQITSAGNVVATGNDGNLGRVASGEGDIWLRITADVRPSFGRTGNNNQAQLSWSTDGSTFQQLGGAYNLHNRWEFFVAFRFGVFNYATKAIGGTVKVKEFKIENPDSPGTPNLPSSSISKPSSMTSTSRQPGATGVCAQLYGQCGGRDWTGPMCCAQGTCNASNEWYSQCL
ncbi:putative beta-xylosidase [Paramyrothecium foliicola]|nr:putative beta-xylosidase [Paramyrothecium foliicola]